jgi:hypothetical protein
MARTFEEQADQRQQIGIVVDYVELHLFRFYRQLRT